MNYIKRIIRLSIPNFLRVMILNLKAMSTTEIKILEKKYSEKIDSRESILFFCPHKSASTFVGKLLYKLDKFYDVANLSNFIEWKIKDFSKKYSDHEEFYAENFDLFFPNGLIYGPLRKAICHPKGANFKKIFLIRDPRDSIISFYYSMAFNHAEPIDLQFREKFLQRRHTMQSMDINEYSKTIGLNFFKDSYRGLINEITLSKKKVLLLKYENLIKDPISGYSELISFLNLPKDNELEDFFVKELTPNKVMQNRSHKRSGKAKQYIEELSQDTIDFIEQELSEILTFFDYY